MSWYKQRFLRCFWQRMLLNSSRPLDSTFLPRQKKAIRVKMQRTFWLLEAGFWKGSGSKTYRLWLWKRYIYIYTYNSIYIYIEVDHEVASWRWQEMIFPKHLFQQPACPTQLVSTSQEWHKRILSNNSDEQGKQTSVQEERNFRGDSSTWLEWRKYEYIYIIYTNIVLYGCFAFNTFAVYLYSSIVYYITLYYTMLYYTVVCYTLLHCVVSFGIILQYL